MTQKKAILYVRVSTDEQADKGFSLQHQEERLRQYCVLQNIYVVGFYREDHSAKSFERPEFNKLLARLKKEKGSANLLLFLKWDRFSRNAGDAYGMISQLNKLGVEPQAIEQPLDLNIPENKIMLAFYLAAPEVENDRRALNTVAGMRRAKKEGRWVGCAPIGYKNMRDERKQPVVVPSDKAPIIKWIFEQLASCTSNSEAIRLEAMKKGLNTAKGNYYLIIKNPFYCGRIYIPAYKDEAELIVKGVHEPLISEQLFDEVQMVMQQKKRNWPTKQTAREEFPLRGHLICANCGAKLTASTSKGNGGNYSYYHCTPKCGERFKAEEVNQLFAQTLQTVTTNEVSLDILDHYVASLFTTGKQDIEKERQRLAAEIQKSKERLVNAQELLLDGTIDALEYKAMKQRLEPSINQLETKLRNSLEAKNESEDVIKFAREFFKNLDRLYLEGNLLVRQQLIGSMFPEKLIFEKKSFRTIEENPLIPLMRKPSKGFGASKHKKSSQYVNFSTKAPLNKNISNRISESLKSIFKLKVVIKF